MLFKPAKAQFILRKKIDFSDAAFVVVRDGVETALHASRWLGMERMDTSVGPISIEVLEPLPLGFNSESEQIFAGRRLNRNTSAKGRWVSVYRLRSRELAAAWANANGIRLAEAELVGHDVRSAGPVATAAVQIELPVS